MSLFIESCTSTARSPLSECGILFQWHKKWDDWSIPDTQVWYLDRHYSGWRVAIYPVLVGRWPFVRYCFSSSWDTSHHSHQTELVGHQFSRRWLNLAAGSTGLHGTSSIRSDIYIYIYICWPIVVEGKVKTHFSIATPPRCKEEHNSFTWIVPLTLDPYLIMLHIKQSGIKNHFLSHWYDSTWDWTGPLANG